MKPELVAAGALLATTHCSASWAQAPTDTNALLSHTAMPATHLTVGSVEGIDAAARSVTIDHQVMPSSGMPAMTMQFQLVPSSQLALEPGLSTAFTFTASADGITIGSAQPLQVGGNAVLEGRSAEPSMPNMDRCGVGGMPGTMDSCRAMMRGNR